MIEKLKTPSVYISNDIEHVFEKDTLYRVISKVRKARVDPTILIHDVKSMEYIPLRYHVDHDDYPANFQLSLESQFGHDVRHYSIQFPLQHIKSTMSLRRINMQKEKSESLMKMT